MDRSKSSMVSSVPYNPGDFNPTDAFEGAKWRFRTGGRPKGLILGLTAAEPAPPGSQDVTIVTIKASAATGQGTSTQTFSFSTDDLKYGPIQIPAFHAYITDVQGHSSAKGTERTRVRQMIPTRARAALRTGHS